MGNDGLILGGQFEFFLILQGIFRISCRNLVASPDIFHCADVQGQTRKRGRGE